MTEFAIIEEREKIDQSSKLEGRNVTAMARHAYNTKKSKWEANETIKKNRKNSGIRVNWSLSV